MPEKRIVSNPLAFSSYRATPKTLPIPFTHNFLSCPVFALQSYYQNSSHAANALCINVEFSPYRATLKTCLPVMCQPKLCLFLPYKVTFKTFCLKLNLSCPVGTVFTLQSYFQNLYLLKAKTVALKFSPYRATPKTVAHDRCTSYRLFCSYLTELLPEQKKGL